MALSSPGSYVTCSCCIHNGGEAFIENLLSPGSCTEHFPYAILFHSVIILEVSTVVDPLKTLSTLPVSGTSSYLESSGGLRKIRMWGVGASLG